MPWLDCARWFARTLNKLGSQEGIMSKWLACMEWVGLVRPHCVRHCVMNCHVSMRGECVMLNLKTMVQVQRDYWKRC
jgi:hypothetical protein